ncbi:MAG: ABC transporter permease [Chloroflexi bacterium CFX1]|nr:ABC transporter permease [Chloroflexi bacterium CFX1]MCQ3953692.1 peptide ABC transporter permease [Chloroflexota bacterium]MDL1920119.1 ABC transporter permease [Chloroflexi bacterium CFX5]NUQ59387.1 ABC transporter permease [Anaerolineales bacterium]
MASLILRRFFKHRLAGVAIAVMLVLIASSLLADLNPYSPTAQNPSNKLRDPNAAHWMGTDELGRDVLSRIIHGGRVSLAVGLFSTLLSISLGVAVGALSGFFGGWIDSILMRVTDAFLTFPSIFVLIILGAFLREQQLFILQNSIFVVIVIIAALSWMWPARLVRGLFLVLREKEFVSASKALGGSSFRLIVRHILPNCAGPILVSGTLQMASAIITESGLSYLGFGVQPPTPTWGSILSTAQNQIFTAPWLGFFPGAMIFITVMAINYIGDGLRDAFDPYVIHTE